MNIEKITQFVKLANELEEDGVIGFTFHSKEIHARAEDMQGFDNLQIENRGNDNPYPYEIYKELEGFKIFCLVKQEDLKEFPQFRNFRKAELLKQLAALEEEEVTAV